MGLFQKKRFTIVLRYKSGHTVEFTTEAFEYKTEGGQLISATWQNAKPRPLMMNVDEVESVWEK